MTGFEIFCFVIGFILGGSIFFYVGANNKKTSKVIAAKAEEISKEAIEKAEKEIDKKVAEVKTKLK
jgi:membrane protein DedA with SNARE-associated domain